MMWADILTKTLQGSSFRELTTELIKCPVEYEEKSNGEDVGKTIGVSGSNVVHTVNYNAQNRSYAEATR